LEELEMVMMVLGLEQSDEAGNLAKSHKKFVTIVNELNFLSEKPTWFC